MKVISVRLDQETNLELEERSKRLGIPPAVLARSFIKGALDGGVDLTIPDKAGHTPELPPEVPSRISGGSNTKTRTKKRRGKR